MNGEYVKIAIVVLAVIGLYTVIMRAVKLIKVMNYAKEQYQLTIENFQAEVVEKYGIVGSLENVGNKIKDALEYALNKALEPFKKLYKWVMEQLYEIIPFLIFQLLFIYALMYYLIIPDHNSIIKNSLGYIVVFVLFTVVIGATYAIWWVFQQASKADETYGGYILRKEISFFKMLFEKTKDIFKALFIKKKENYASVSILCSSFGLCRKPKEVPALIPDETVKTF